MYVKPFYKHLFEGKGKTARKTLFVDVSEVQQVIFLCIAWCCRFSIVFMVELSTCY